MDKLYKKLEIYPKNKELYEQAFRHSSFVNELGQHVEDYERLEFLGDAFIDLVVSEFLYTNFRLKEGIMTFKRANFVCEKALAVYSRDLELEKYIKVGSGEEFFHIHEMDSILSDVFEAFFGAIYLDLGYNLASSTLLKVIKPYISDLDISFHDNFKKEFQEKVQAGQSVVRYELVKEEGPDHQKEFTMRAVVDGVTFGEGRASSKKEAEQLAAKMALEKYTQGGKDGKN